MEPRFVVSQDRVYEHVPGFPRTLIVAGIGRSGTGYVAEVLRESGLRARHKHVFRGGGTVPCARCLDVLDVEVSGFAMPHLWDPCFRGCMVAQVVRHPLDWLVSWETKRYATQYLERHLGFAPADPWGGQVWTTHQELERMVPSDQFYTDALRVWVTWNLFVAQRATMQFRVEDMTAETVKALAILAGAPIAEEQAPRVDAALGFTPVNFNTDRPLETERRKLSWRKLPRSEWRTRAMKLTAHYGYDNRLR